MSDIGETLRNARYDKGSSLEQASAATRIKPAFLEAIENGEYHLLPGPAYITGFLRNYSAYLGLHPDDVLQQYHRIRPVPQPALQAATRVLASGQDRVYRARLMWTVSAIFLLLVGGFAIRQYNATYAHPYAPGLNVTPADLGGSRPIHRVVQPQRFFLALRATSPVWVRVTADGHQVFQGILRPRAGKRHFSGYSAIYVATFDGAHIRAFFNGRSTGRISRTPGLIFDVATSKGWSRVS